MPDDETCRISHLLLHNTLERTKHNESCLLAAKINMESELIRHFLIEPCKQGVRLKGSNNEPAFPSLVALIFQHSVTKMALPIELQLPNEGNDIFMTCL